MQAALQRSGGVCSVSGRTPGTCARVSSRSAHRACARAASAAAGPTADQQQPPVPVVEPTVLPPPSTGSQYRWRWRSPPRDSSPPGGNGGRGSGNRRQRSTRDWGNGRAGGGLLYALLFRVRMMVVYGMWITLMYGAVHTAVGLMTGAAHSVAGLASWVLHGRREQPAVTAVADGAAAAEAWPPEAAAGLGSEAAEGAASYVDDQGHVCAATAALGGAAGGASSAGAGTAFGAAETARGVGQQKRKSNGLLADVLIIYVLVMGSVLVFASNG